MYRRGESEYGVGRGLDTDPSLDPSFARRLFLEVGIGLCVRDQECGNKYVAE